MRSRFRPVAAFIQAERAPNLKGIVLVYFS